MTSEQEQQESRSLPFLSILSFLSSPPSTTILFTKHYHGSWLCSPRLLRRMHQEGATHHLVIPPARHHQPSSTTFFFNVVVVPLLLLLLLLVSWFCFVAFCILFINLFLAAGAGGVASASCWLAGWTTALWLLVACSLAAMCYGARLRATVSSMCSHRLVLLVLSYHQHACSSYSTTLMVVVSYQHSVAGGWDGDLSSWYWLLLEQQRWSS